MSENNLQLDENTTHFIYGDQEYILDQGPINPELRDLICNEGPKAILVDGQYILTDSNTILLQGGDTNLTQFYINDGNEAGFVIDGGDSSVNNLFQNAECVQLVEEDTNDVQQIVYYTNEELSNEAFTPVQELSEEGDIQGIQDEDGNIYPFKRIKLEGQMLNFDEFIQKEESNEETSDENIQFTILEDQSELSNVEGTSETDSSTKTTENEISDLAKITGRNLITGQTVTLHSYMEKLKKRLHKTSLHKTPGRKIYNDEVRKPEITDLVDRKILIGKTKTGKKIMGKILSVDRKHSTPEPENETTTTPEPENLEIHEKDTTIETPPVTDPPVNQIIIKTSVVAKESFEQICKTLSGVMEMESVRKKLEKKNLVVKLVEKKYVSESDSYEKKTSHSYGFMEKEVEDGEEKWKFVPDAETQEVLLGEEEEGEKKTARFTITTSLTILVTYEKGGAKTVRVNLNPAPGNLCTVCAQYFKSNLKLRQHMNQVHNTYGYNSTCKACDQFFNDPQKFKEHCKQHIENGELFNCSECDKCFPSEVKLKKHFAIHDVHLRPLECSVCEVRCANETTLKKHLMTHMGVKPYACDICSKQFMTHYDVNFHRRIHFPDKNFTCHVCGRTFSRHSNLLRHTEIHKGTGALFKCDICGCSFNYISSLTRHVVQNHIDADKLKKVVNDKEEEEEEEK
ncbi:zinc finger and SCAN domain-containing protein 21-like isoform X2 [Tribolium madens]|nr:zinc finger and SCAN domain-containing protein 21-like isoform X2 [Tribolium madens]